MSTLTRALSAVLGSILVLAGCGEPASATPVAFDDGGIVAEPALEETSLAMLGGEPTTAFPHVGFLTTSAVAQGCTATLLAPRISVTAAHCVTGRTYAISYGRSSYTVNGTARFDRHSTAWPEDAAVVVHAPVHGITPARLVAPPAAGRDRIRVVGAGYDGGRSFLAPTRTSLFNLDGIVGSWTGAATLVISESTSDARVVQLCSGDSGSPLFLASDSRALVGVISNIRVDSRPANGIVCGRSASAAQAGAGPVGQWLREQVAARR